MEERRKIRQGVAIHREPLFIHCLFPILFSHSHSHSPFFIIPKHITVALVFHTSSFPIMALIQRAQPSTKASVESSGGEAIQHKSLKSIPTKHAHKLYIYISSCFNDSLRIHEPLREDIPSGSSVLICRNVSMMILSTSSILLLPRCQIQPILSKINSNTFDHLL